MNQENPFATPDAELDTGPAPGLLRDYGGIGRLAYFGYTVLFTFLSMFIVGGLAAAGGLSSLLLTQGILALVSFVLAYKRLINIGDNGWLCLLLMIPLVNIFIGVRCLAYPTGYADHKQLDTAAKVIIGLFVGIIVIGVIFGILAEGA